MGLRASSMRLIQFILKLKSSYVFVHMARNSAKFVPGRTIKH